MRYDVLYIQKDQSASEGFFLRVMHFGIFKQVQEFILTIPAGSVETTCHIKQAPRHQNDISDRSVWAGNLSASPIGYYFSDTHTHTHTHTELRAESTGRVQTTETFSRVCEENEFEPLVRLSLYLCPLTSGKHSAVCWKSLMNKIWLYFTCRREPAGHHRDRSDALF